MACGIVLISVEPGREYTAYRAMLGVHALTDVRPLLGSADFIANISAADTDEMAKIIIEEIRSIKGVVGTKTLIVDDFLLHLLKIVEPKPGDGE